MAADYDYLLFHTADDSEITLTAQGLKIVFTDESLVATSGDESLTLSKTALGYMKFTNSSVTSIQSLKSGAAIDGEASIYSISGVRMKTASGTNGNYEDCLKDLPSGVYIINVAGKTQKVVVK